MIFFAIKIIVALVLLSVVVVAVYIAVQGREELHFDVEKRTKSQLIDKTEQKLNFEVEVPISNEGKDEGILLDAFIRAYLPQEQYADVQLRGRVNLKDVPRGDDYFEAMILGPGVKKTLAVKFEIVPLHGVSLKQAVNGMPDVDVALFLDCRGRRGLYTVKKIITLHKEELKGLVD